MDLGVVDPRVKEARLIAAATDDDIASYVVEGITYASLAQGPHNYIQCAVREEPPYGFWLAYVDGTEGVRHHAMEVPIRLEQVLRGVSQVSPRRRVLETRFLVGYTAGVTAATATKNLSVGCRPARRWRDQKRCFNPLVAPPRERMNR